MLYAPVVGVEDLPPCAGRASDWLEYNCAGDNELIRIGQETYYRGGDGT